MKMDLGLLGAFLIGSLGATLEQCFLTIIFNLVFRHPGFHCQPSQGLLLNRNHGDSPELGGQVHMHFVYRGD